ncbi:hypothetical protein B0G77_2193 [Paraburkholderia sp. BL10I2N1]|nr:hypothetical protein B0G77_2193 [Paraburkholderia sp. BL10I2N1]
MFSMSGNGDQVMKRVTWMPPCRHTFSKQSPQAYRSQQRLPVQLPRRWAAGRCSASVDRCRSCRRRRFHYRTVAVGMPIESAYHGALCEEALFFRRYWIRLRPHCDGASARRSSSRCVTKSRNSTPFFSRQALSCQWNFPDPMETKTGAAGQEWTFRRVFRRILRRVSVLIALPLHSKKAAERPLAVNTIAETAPGSIATD